MKFLEKINSSRFLQFSAGIAILLVSLSLVFSNTIKPILNKKTLTQCREEAQDLYERRWNEYCQIDKRQIGQDGSCLLPHERADQLSDDLKDLDEACFKKYPQK